MNIEFISKNLLLDIRASLEWFSFPADFAEEVVFIIINLEDQKSTVFSGSPLSYPIAHGFKEDEVSFIFSSHPKKETKLFVDILFDNYLYPRGKRNNKTVVVSDFGEDSVLAPLADMNLCYITPTIDVLDIANGREALVYQKLVTTCVVSMFAIISEHKASVKMAIVIPVSSSNLN